MTRRKPETTRHGLTRKMTLAKVEVYATLNRDKDGRPIELFAKATEGWQGWVDVLCETASLAMQYGCPLSVLARHWRGHRFPPDGIAGEGSSVPDAIARWLEEEAKK